MSHDSGRFLDHLYEMDDTEFEHVYELTKRDACVKFNLEAYTIGAQDGFAHRAYDNGYTTATGKRDYDQGYAVGIGRCPAGNYIASRREFGQPLVWP